tara:strand:+ start:343 stop:693 length:351 start_codon:yes stop_codon:yes gene_type:complete
MTYQKSHIDTSGALSRDAHKVIEALAPRTRWEIYEHVTRRAYSVGEIARLMPVSRPAVSQHLKILKDVGLVQEEVDGVRHIFRADPRQLAVLRRWLDGFWDQALDNMKHLMETQDD